LSHIESSLLRERSVWIEDIYSVEVMSLTNKNGDMIYFSEENGKRYALYRTEVMTGGKPLKATAYLPDDDSLWIGNEAGGLYLMGGENDDGLFDRHMPEIITTKENTNE
jgi:hypothetical protein